MKKIIINVSYIFDTEAWQDSYIKNDIIEIKNNDIHTSIKDYINKVDFVDFTKAKFETEIYEDNESGEAMQKGFIYRFNTKFDDNKLYRGDCWVSIEGVLQDFKY